MGSKGEPGGRERLDEVKEQRTVGAVAYTVAPVCAQLLATLNDALTESSFAGGQFVVFYRDLDPVVAARAIQVGVFSGVIDTIRRVGPDHFRRRHGRPRRPAAAQGGCARGD